LKIKTLTLNNFRGFPGPGATTFNLDGKNLLIYGENGSGKSSVFHALRAFFSTSPKTLPLSLDHEGGRNQFSGDQNCSISVEFDDNTPALSWDHAAADPAAYRADPRVVEADLRASFLDYKSLLRTNFSHGDATINLFDVIVGTILADYTVQDFYGRSKALLELYAEAWYAIPSSGGDAAPGTPEFVSKYPPKLGFYTRQSQKILEGIEVSRKEFSLALRDALAALLPIVSTILTKLPARDIEIMSFDFDNIEYNRDTRTFSGAQVEPRVKVHTYNLPRPQSFLNEARLSALAIALYLGGRSQLVPKNSDYVANGLAVPLKLLVLDDVLIGLDMSNRSAVLEVLRDMFSEWQIVLLTHDYIWYEMVRMGADRDKWAIYEMYRGEDVDKGFDRPVVKEFGTGWQHLPTVADTHLTNHDSRAAAVYARAAFEGWVKKRAHGRIDAKYSMNPNEPLINDLWTAIKKASENQNGIVPPAKAILIANLEVARKIVLNPLSHGAGNPVVEIEVQGAINAVRALGGL
jgi:energy-coupling factor transporter ATP-binding protein EcfA2